MNGTLVLNPNYKPGSTNINEGKYTFGDTLTSRLKSGLDSIGNCKVTDDSIPGLSQNDVEVYLEEI
jgi:chitinase